MKRANVPGLEVAPPDDSGISDPAGSRTLTVVRGRPKLILKMTEFGRKSCSLETLEE